MKSIAAASFNHNRMPDLLAAVADGLQERRMFHDAVRDRKP